METRAGKHYLEDLLNTRVCVFVPPNNKIGKAGVRQLSQQTYISAMVAVGV